MDPRRKTPAAPRRAFPIYIYFPFPFVVVVVEKLAEVGGAHLSVASCHGCRRGHVKARWVDGFRLRGPPVSGTYRDDGPDAMRRRPGSCVCLPFSVFNRKNKKKNVVACMAVYACQHVCMHDVMLGFICKPVQDEMNT